MYVPTAEAFRKMRLQHVVANVDQMSVDMGTPASIEHQVFAVCLNRGTD